MSAIGKKMQEIREQQRISQAELGDRVGGIHGKTWGRWEKKGPPRRSLPAVARALGISVEELTGETNQTDVELVQALRALAIVYNLTEGTGIQARDQEVFRRAFASYVDMLESVGSGDLAPNVSEEEMAQVKNDLAEIIKRVSAGSPKVLKTKKK